jgi:hypothetical protein
VELETQPNHRQLAVARVNRIPSVSDNETITRLAAKALILELQHGKPSSVTTNKNVSPLQAQSDDVSVQNEETVETGTLIKRRIIELSLKHNILSPYTAFIGVEKRINGNNVDMVLREVPIQISADDQRLKSSMNSYAGIHFALSSAYFSSE